MRVYRVALVGCGPRGTAAALAYHSHPRTAMVGVCDLSTHLAGKLAGDLDLDLSQRFTDLDEMLEKARPEIVVIATGTECHYDLCLRVLARSINIDVEKPICSDLEQSDEVVSLAKTKGARIAVHHQSRVGVSMEAVARAVKDGLIGDVWYITSAGKGYYGGLELMNICPHALTNVLKFGGKCRAVTAIGLTDGRPITPADVLAAPLGMGTIACEQITAGLEFEGGVTASLLQHRFRPMHGDAYAMELRGTRGRLFWRRNAAWLLDHPHFLPDETHTNWQPLAFTPTGGFDPSCGADEDDYRYVEEYVRALDEGRDHECSGSAAVHVMEIMMAVFESAAHGTRVALPQVRRDHPLLRWCAEAGLGLPEKKPRDYGEWLQVEDRRLGRPV